MSDPVFILKGKSCLKLKVRGPTGYTGQTGPAGSDTGIPGATGPTGPSGQPFENILFNASGTGLQSIPPLDSSNVMFPNITPLPFNYAIGNISYDTTTSVYTINTAGFYYFYTTLDVQSESNLVITIFIEKSGIEFVSSQASTIDPQILSLTLVGQCFCSVGDEIAVHVHNNNNLTPLMIPDMSIRNFGGYRIA